MHHDVRHWAAAALCDSSRLLSRMSMVGTMHDIPSSGWTAHTLLILLNTSSMCSFCPGSDTFASTLPASSLALGVLDTMIISSRLDTTPVATMWSFSESSSAILAMALAASFLISWFPSTITRTSSASPPYLESWQSVDAAAALASRAPTWDFASVGLSVVHSAVDRASRTVEVLSPSLPANVHTSRLLSTSWESSASRVEPSALASHR
mmetsp:Transcript_49107/g.117733  ORF Transcript_49107/g.117733 Transcript_49107/m.117733 type:complete len:209 (-) Transcript_49107:53-679(-)